MTVELKGNSGTCLTAGILLLTRARSFGQRLDVAIVGSADEITPIKGPALLHSPVLATCGVGRRSGNRAQVIVPGKPTDPLAVSLSEGGDGGWFYIDRTGAGRHPGALGFSTLFRGASTELKAAGRELSIGLSALGCAPEPALLDLLFEAPVDPVVRLAFALRAGRAISGEGGDLTAHLGEASHAIRPLKHQCSLQDLKAFRSSGSWAKAMEGLSGRSRQVCEDWLSRVWPFLDSNPPLSALVCGLAEVATHALAMPNPGYLPPLAPHMDAVAVGVGSALGAVGKADDASAALADTYRFLGGRFISDARYPIELSVSEPPEGRLERWRWFCEGTKEAAKAADSLWRQVVDPVQ